MASVFKASVSVPMNRNCVSGLANAISAMARRGIDISGHISQGLSRDVVLQADHIFVMTSGHRAAILSIDTSVADRVQLVLGDVDVDDPIGGSEDEYEQCAASMEQGLRERLQEIEV